MLQDNLRKKIILNNQVLTFIGLNCIAKSTTNKTDCFHVEWTDFGSQKIKYNEIHLVNKYVDAIQRM